MVLALYYDGQTAKRREVRLSTDGVHLWVEGEELNRTVELHGLRVSEPLGSTPRLITFADGAVCEVRDLPGLKRLLEVAGHRDGWIDLLQRRWSMALACALLLVGVFVAAYIWGLPRAVVWMAGRIPPAVTNALSERALASMDATLLRPSVLPRARTDEIGRRFSALARPEKTERRETILYRASGGFYPNAFALPDGTIVLLDELVTLAEDDEQILAVLAHELGHVHHRHGLRMLLQSSVVAAFAGWWLGDFSSLLAVAPVALLQARYSRELETEADDYAATMLRANRIAPARLAEILERIEKSASLHTDASLQWLDYLSSHPAPQERIETLRRR